MELMMTVHHKIHQIHSEAPISNVVHLPRQLIWLDVDVMGYRADRTAIAEPLSVLMKMIPNTSIQTALRAIQASGLIWPKRGEDQVIFPIELANALNWNLKGGRDA